MAALADGSYEPDTQSSDSPPPPPSPNLDRWVDNSHALPMDWNDSSDDASTQPPSSSLASASSSVLPNEPHVLLRDPSSSPGEVLPPQAAIRLGTDTQVQIDVATDALLQTVLDALKPLALPPNVVRETRVGDIRRVMVNGEDPVVLRIVMAAIVPPLQRPTNTRVFTVLPEEADVAGLVRATSSSLSLSSDNGRSRPVVPGKRRKAWDD